METLKFNKNLESELMSMEMDFWRRSARCSRLEKIRNNVIREKIYIKKPVLDYMRYKQLNWYDHAQRMYEIRLPRNISFVACCTTRVSRTLLVMLEI